MRRFKAWLKLNAPLIDFASKIVIGAAALIISFSAYRVAERQSEIAEQQLRLAEVGSEPDLYVKHTLVQNQQTGKYEHAQLQVHNTGGQAHNIDVMIDSFISVRRWTPERTLSFVPLTAYYFAHFEMGTPQGLIFQALGYKSNEKFGELYDALLTEEFNKKYGFVEVGVTTVVQIAYTTRSGQRRKASFLNGRKMPEKDIADLIGVKKRADELICFVQIEKLNADQLLHIEERLRRNERCL
jgi:hypothetical protein